MATGWLWWEAGQGSSPNWRCEVRKIKPVQETYWPALLGVEWEVRKYELLTPLIGGGVVPFVNDLQMPIRGGTIRGLLRFWWRATCGNRFGDLQGMRSAEVALWGSTDRASLVEVCIEASADISSLKKTHERKDRPNSKVVPGYVSWPLNPPKENPNDIKSVLTKLHFELQLRYPRELDGRNVEEEIKLTLWAFDFFGGVGSRTRRGAGAICRLANDGSPFYERKDLNWGWLKIKELPWPDGVPHLDINVMPTVVKATWQEMTNRHKSFFSEHFSKSMRSNLEAITPIRTALGAPFKWKQAKVDARLASPILYRPIRLKEGDFCVLVALHNLGRQSPKANPKLVKEFFNSLGGNL